MVATNVLFSHSPPGNACDHKPTRPSTELLEPPHQPTHVGGVCGAGAVAVGERIGVWVCGWWCGVERGAWVRGRVWGGDGGGMGGVRAAG